VSAARLEELRRLADWAPPLGVISVYLALDPADRGGAWRTELRNGLTAVVNGDEALDHETTKALRATTERIAERFANHERSLPRGEVGFVEVSARPGAESWWTSHLAPDTPVPVVFGARPLVAPFVDLLERGSPRGVALLSGERVRLLEWVPGRVEELHNWELTVFSRDWRERKAPRATNPARAQAVSTSGHDQFEERLEENRHRFLGECGGLAARNASERDWAELLLFGAPEHRREFEQGISVSELRVQAADHADLISEQASRLAAPIGEAVERIEASTERKLAEHAIDEARGGSRGTVGAQETEAALAEGRVETLLFDASHAAGFEEMVRRALESGAGLVAVAGPGAEMLSGVEGVAAILRY
jgi:peptide subunit release factor 1 (eRF1)